MDAITTRSQRTQRAGQRGYKKPRSIRRRAKEGKQRSMRGRLVTLDVNSPVPNSRKLARSFSEHKQPLFFSPEGQCLTTLSPDELVQDICETNLLTAVEPNLSLVQPWDDTDNDSESDIDSLFSSNSDMGELTYDRQHWHTLLLRAYARQHNRYFPGTDGMKSLSRFDVFYPVQLKVERDGQIPVPLSHRRLWYRLLEELRRFPRVGLLIPTKNAMIKSVE